MANETLVRVTFQSTSGLPRDRFVNDWAFIASGPLTQAICDELADDLFSDFYNFTFGGDKVSNYIGDVVDRGTSKALLAFYDVSGHLGGTPAGSPAFTNARTLGAPSEATCMPEEVAYCLSFHADLTGTVERGPSSATIPTPDRAIDMGAPAVHTGFTKPRARRRGRIYLGPFTKASAVESGGHIFANLNLQTVVQGAAASLLASTTTEWSVWSRTDSVFRPVTGGFNDNAFDTVRKRGTVANGRVLF